MSPSGFSYDREIVGIISVPKQMSSIGIVPVNAKKIPY
jgi:hypothetical protein